MRLALVLLAASVLLTACDPWDSSPTDPAPGGARTLAVPFVAQQTPVWCWAAVSEMVIRYYRGSVTQCQILSGWYGRDCCSFPSSCQTTAPLHIIQQTLHAHGVGSLYVPRPLSFQEVATEIDLGRPIIIAYRGSFVGHVVVLYGYEPGGFVFIHDPFYGTFERVPFGASFSYGGQMVWSETLAGLR